MATLREIRRRIGGVRSTQKITKAMKMVAAAKLRRAQDAVISARPYARKMKDLLQHLAGVVDVGANPLFEERTVEKTAVIVVSSDRGLCGAFNSNIIRAAVAHIASTEFPRGVHIIPVGRKCAEFFVKNGYRMGTKYVGVFGTLHFSTAQAIVAEAVNGFLNGEYDRVDVVYNEFKSIIQQRVTTERLLPIPRAAVEGAHHDPRLNYIYEPSDKELISALVPKHLNFQMWRILLESNAAEHGARMTAMDNATTNAADLIRTLELSYNKARQASITKELLEIVSGAEALKSSV